MDARKALFGQTNQEGRPPESDLQALRHLGSEHYRDLARRDWAKMKVDREPEVRSDRKLAEDAVRHFGLPSNASERLRKKFKTQKKKWLEIELYHDDVPETLEFNSLQSIHTILLHYDIKMNLTNIEN